MNNRDALRTVLDKLMSDLQQANKDIEVKRSYELWAAEREIEHMKWAIQWLEGNIKNEPTDH